MRGGFGTDPSDPPQPRWENPRAISAAALSANRVLPTPPLPVRVSNRVVARSLLSSRSSSRRPTKLVSSTGKFDGRALAVLVPTARQTTLPSIRSDLGDRKPPQCWCTWQGSLRSPLERVQRSRWRRVKAAVPGGAQKSSANRRPAHRGRQTGGTSGLVRRAASLGHEP